MKKYIITSVLALLVIGGLQSCFKKTDILTSGQVPVLPASPYRYSQVDSELPAHFQGFSVTNGMGMFGEVAQIDDNVASLGRVLFYDPKLSLNNLVSCASCHRQANGFSDTKALSVGFEGKITSRNSMPIVNPGMLNNLFWDSRSSSVEDLVLRPIQNHIEMGMEDMNVLARKLTNVEYYPDLFQTAYGDKMITEARINEALSHFLRSMVTCNAKYDEGKATNFDNFNSLEKLGYSIFTSDRAKCASCHKEPTFTAATFGGRMMPNGDPNNGGMFVIDPIAGENGDNPYAQTAGTTNIGLDRVPTDAGRQNGEFKIPSLRNAEITAPYMHDGRFNTLEEVVEHYSSGIQPNPSLDKKFKNTDGTVKNMNFSEIEKKALVAFLKTLTDKKFTTDAKYSNPFRKK